MAIQLRNGFTGLHTNIAESQMPPGALLGAENVVIRRPGAIEPRNGMQKAGTVVSGTGWAAWGFSWAGIDFYLRNNGSNVFDWRKTTGTPIIFFDPALGSINPQPFRRDVFAKAELRGNLYYSYDSGTLRYVINNNWFMAGLPIQAVIGGGTASLLTNTWLANNERVAYRVLVMRKDENGVVVRSGTSGAFIVSNTSGAARAVSLSITNNNLGGVSQYVEVYRSASVPTSVTPPDEMQLVGTFPSPGGGGHVFLDFIAPTARGATLYTSPSRGGIAQQNNRPPAAACIAAYRGSVFFGNVRGPRTIKFSVSPSTVALTGAATGVGSRVYTADVTSGSADLTSASSTVGLQKGMVVDNANFPFFDAYITNISGSTITVSRQATGTAAGATVQFRDAVKLGNRWVPVAGSLGTPGFESQVVGYAEAGTWQVYEITPPEGGYTKTYVVETVSRAATAQTTQATHGDEYNPPLPLYDATPLSLDQDAFAGGLMWSKTDEPEHVAPANYTPVGDTRKAILGLVPTRDALFILKEDGVFRLTGVAGEWRIDPVDPTTFCVLPSSVKAMHGRGYFLSQKGVLTISDSGLELVSAPVDDVWKPIVDGVIDRWTSSGLYELSGVTGASTACVFDRENEYTILTSDSGPAYVFNGNTGAWTTWSYYKHTETLPNRALFNFERTGKCVHALGADYYTTILTTSSIISIALSGPRFDREVSVTATSYSAVNSTVTLSGSITAPADDLIQDAGGKLWRITANASGTVVSVQLMGDTTGAAFTTGSCVLYRSLRSTVTIGVMEPTTQEKRWKKITTAWSLLSGAVVLRHAFQSSMSTTSIAEDTDLRKRVNGYTTHTYGYAQPWLIPTAHARAWAIRASTTVVQAFGNYRLEGVSLTSDAMDESSPAEVAL